MGFVGAEASQVAYEPLSRKWSVACLGFSCGRWKRQFGNAAQTLQQVPDLGRLPSSTGSAVISTHTSITMFWLLMGCFPSAKMIRLFFIPHLILRSTLPTTLVYSFRKPTKDGRTELILTPLELLNRLSKLITPPRVHKHRYCGVLDPNAKLGKAVIETAGPSGATLQLLTEAREKMEQPEAGDQSEDNQQGRTCKLAARCWAMLLARIYECLPLTCAKCGQPMRLIAFIMEPVVIEKILSHIGEPTEPPAVLSARAPPQVEMDFDQVSQANEWPDMDQTAGASGETRN